MNDTTQTLIRALVKIGAGYLLSKGWADSSSAEMISAGAMAAVGVAWGVMHRTPGQNNNNKTDNNETKTESSVNGNGGPNPGGSAGIGAA